MNGKGNTAISLFSGAGGLDLGFKWAGWNVIWANDLSTDATATHKKHFGGTAINGDILELISTVPAARIVIGGPPCQSFSLVGKRDIDDPRGRLVFAFLDVVKRILPEAFVMENVPGLAASKIDGLRLHHYLLQEFSALGYEVGILPLDATDFGVPQRRKRLFLIGFRFGGKIPHDLVQYGRSFVFDWLGMDIPTNPTTASQALDDLPVPVERGATAPPYQCPPHSWFAEFVRKNINNGDAVNLHEMPTMSDRDRSFVTYIPPGGNYTSIPDEISTRRILNFKRTGGRTTTYGRLHPDRPAYTINTFFNRPNVGANYHYKQDRLITVREALRLQSFPDWFTPVFSSQRSLHMQVGNAVPPLMALGVAGMVNTVIKAIDKA